MDYKIRKIQKQDNKAVERIIRTCLIEFGANHEGTAWADPDLGRFYELYNNRTGYEYWVAEDKNGSVIGGTGIGRLDGAEDICRASEDVLPSPCEGNRSTSPINENCPGLCKTILRSLLFRNIRKYERSSEIL